MARRPGLRPRGPVPDSGPGQQRPCHWVP